MKYSFLSFISILLFFSCQKEEETTPEVIIPEAISDLFSDRMDKGLVESSLIKEASGLAVSRSNPNVLWTHNDSGDEARLFLLANDGKHLGIFKTEGLSNRDWEDMAIAKDPSDGLNYIFIGDIGDNNAQFDTKFIYKFPEPHVQGIIPPVNLTIPQAQIQKISFQYPDGNRDAESLLVDTNGDIYVVSKRENEVSIYKAAYPQATNQSIMLEKTGTIAITSIVGGDFSADGKEILLKTYDKIFIWQKNNPSISTAELFKTISPKRIPYSAEAQGEAIAWKPDGTGYYTLSEEILGIEARLYFYERK